MNTGASTRPRAGALDPRRRAGDQPRAAVVGDVRPRPLDEDEDPVAEHDMDEEPGQPGDPARELDAAQVGDGRRAADRGERALVAIAERQPGPALDHPRDVPRG